MILVRWKFIIMMINHNLLLIIQLHMVVNYFFVTSRTLSSNKSIVSGVTPEARKIPNVFVGEEEDEDEDNLRGIQSRW